jgi:hypothetical protein
VTGLLAKAFELLSPRVHAVLLLFVGTLEDKIYRINLHTLHEVKDNNWKHIQDFPRRAASSEPQLFTRCDACLQAQGESFQHLL